MEWPCYRAPDTRQAHTTLATSSRPSCGRRQGRSMILILIFGGWQGAPLWRPKVEQGLWLEYSGAFEDASSVRPPVAKGLGERKESLQAREWCGADNLWGHLCQQLHNQSPITLRMLLITLHSAHALPSVHWPPLPLSCSLTFSAPTSHAAAECPEGRQSPSPVGVGVGRATCTGR